jgi:hypothetical protein
MSDPKTKSPPPDQLLIAFDSTQLRGMSPAERRQAVTRLATLLIEASGMALVERDDEQR